MKRFILCLLALCLSSNVYAAQYAKTFEALLVSQRAAGVTLAGGFAQFVTPGASPGTKAAPTNLKTVYTDRNKTTASANPATLSSDGNIQLFADGIFDIYIYNSAGTLKYSWENVAIRDPSVIESTANYGTLAAAITAIGSTVTELNVDQDETLSANVTVPATLKLNILNGSILTVATGKTLTINGPFSCGDYQAFTLAGTGVVEFGTAANVNINPAWWGASTTASAATNTAAIQASVTALDTGGRWTLGEGEFTTNAAITFQDLSDCTITFQGRLVNDTTGALIFDNMNRCKITGVDVGRSAATAGTWTGKGVDLLNAFNRNILEIDRIFSFEKGLNITMTDDNPLNTGGAWNQIKLGEIRDNKYGYYIEETTNGYWNQNTFIDGHIVLSAAVKSWDTSNGNVTWGGYYDAAVTWIYSNNTHKDTDISNLGNGIKLQSAYNFFLDGVRFESIANYHVDAQSGAALTVRPAIGFDATKYLFTSSMRGITILGAAEFTSSSYKSVLYDDKYGGITFARPDDMDNTLSHLSTDIANFGGVLLHTSWESGYTQRFNKQFADSAAPITGTWLKNSVVWSTDVASGGTKTMGWVASVAGTMGTLSGVTGTIANGSNSMVVNDATNLKINQYLSVTGAASLSGARITNISGTTITLSASNSNPTVTGGAVAFYPAVWVAMPVYP